MEDKVSIEESKLCKRVPPMDEGFDMDNILWKNLPHDLLVKAISKLPLQILALFRAVCKHWYSEVIPSAARQAQASGLPILLYFGCNEGPAWWLQVFSTSSNLTGRVQEFRPSAFPYPRYGEKIRLLASEGGLLVFAFVKMSQDVREIVVCNPLISQSRILDLPSSLRSGGTQGKCTRVSMVVDFPRGNYQLLVQGMDMEGEYRMLSYDSLTCIWCEVKEDVEECPVFLAKRRSSCCNGNLCFCTYVNGSVYVLTFNIQKNTWRRIPMSNLTCPQYLDICRINSYDPQGGSWLWQLQKHPMDAINIASSRRDRVDSDIITGAYCTVCPKRSEIKLMPQGTIHGIEAFLEQFEDLGEVCKGYAGFSQGFRYYHVLQQFPLNPAPVELDRSLRKDFLRIIAHDTNDNSYVQLPIVQGNLFPPNHAILPFNVWSFSASLTAMP